MRVWENWEIRYRDAVGSFGAKNFRGSDWSEAQEFANRKDVTDIAFDMTLVPEQMNGRPIEIQAHREILTKDDLTRVSEEWIERRRNRLRQLV
jgi:hypothetical protein